MRRTFGQLKGPISVVSPEEKYRLARRGLDQKISLPPRAEPLTDRALAWIACFCVVYAAVCTMAPDVAIAAVCSIGLADCNWALRLD